MLGTSSPDASASIFRPLIWPEDDVVGNVVFAQFHQESKARPYEMAKTGRCRKRRLLLSVSIASESKIYEYTYTPTWFRFGFRRKMLWCKIWLQTGLFLHGK